MKNRSFRVFFGVIGVVLILGALSMMGTLLFTGCETPKDNVTLPPLTGTVVIEGNDQQGQTLTANTADLDGSGEVRASGRTTKPMLCKQQTRVQPSP